MSIVSALYTGSSGLQTLGGSLQIIGNNIANINTIGFKASRAEFADLLSQNLGGSALGSQVGRGVKLTGVKNIFTQGAFQSTARVTDLAISGNGFFVVRDDQTNLYTRAGQFGLNADGYLVNLDNLFVQGFVYDSTGVNTGVIGDINLSSLTTPPQQTGTVTISANLDASAVPPTAPFDPTDAAATSNFSTSLSVYDSLGNSHVITIYFEKSNDPTIPDVVTDRSWKWHAVVDGADIVGGTAGTPTEIFSGTATFNTDGSLRTVTQNAGTVDFANGAAAGQTIAFNFGTPTGIAGTGGTGLDGTTQFAGPQVVNFQQQDGFAQGQLQAIDITSDGVVTGVFSNGRSRAVAQIALANFQNPEGLFKMGNNLYAESTVSGLPTLGQPDTGGLGSVASSSLELSNVDLTNEFVAMITNQRGFQANSRVIVVGDELLQDIVNLT
jgi:flagellar hook protein FlgE